jgi:hypothetical protein
LAHRFANDGEAADFAFTVDHFFVREDGAEFGTPIHRSFGNIGEAFGILVIALLLFGSEVRGIGELLDGLGFICGGVEPGIVELEENPLRPLEVVGIGGVDLSRGIGSGA